MSVGLAEMRRVACCFNLQLSLQRTAGGQVDLGLGEHEVEAALTTVLSYVAS